MPSDVKIQFFRYCKYFHRTFFNFLRETKLKIFNSNKELKSSYVDWLFDRNANKPSEYVPICDSNIKTDENTPKIIPFYLPQFHETEINNKYFGKGFMEWYNVTKAVPQYTGHNQPQLPIDVGFYDLSHDDIMYRQIELAKKYGIYGFCFYYYWFSGETLLEKPIENFLKNDKLDFPFCLMWPNETWTSIWGDGEHRKIIKKQELLEGDDDKFVDDIIKYFRDKRYIKIDNRPLFIIYLSQYFNAERFKIFISNLRKKVKEYGFDDVYLMTTNAGHTTVDINEFGFDALVEFWLQNSPMITKNYDLTGRYVNPNFKGRVVDIPYALDHNYHLKPITPNKAFKCVFPGWDNTARKAYKAGCFVFQMCPNDFKKWLSDVIKWTKKNHNKNEQYIFVNAWNEWAEGAHLEPDQRYGYGYLNAVKEAIQENSK